MTAKHAEETRKRVAIYCRVSTSGQEENSSLATQEASCRAHASKHGWEVVAVYRDVFTGAAVFERPGLTELRTAMRAGAFEMLIVHALDRLSRDQNHLGLVLTEAEHAGVEWASATEDIDDSPVGKMLRSVIAGVAEIERLKIKERTQRGKRARVESGRYNPGCRAPYGYRWVDPVAKDRLDIDLLTGPIVRGMFEEIAAGGSLRAVANRLNREGVPTPSGRGVQWFPTSVKVVIENPVCWGEARGFRWQVDPRRGGSGRVRPKSPESHVALPAVAPALVSPEIAAVVKERLARNRQEASRNNRTPEDALLRAGYAVCGYCGKPLTIFHKQHRRNPVYRCNPLNAARFGCPSFGIVAHILDAAVWERVESVLTDPGTIQREVEALRTVDPTKADLAAIDRRVAEIDRRRGNLTRSLATFEDDEDAAPLVAEIKSLGEQRSALAGAREKVEAERLGWQAAQEQLADLEHWCRLQAKNLTRLTYEQKRLALEALGVRATVWATSHDPRYEIKLSLDLESGSIAYTTPTPSTTGTPPSMPRGSTG